METVRFGSTGMKVSRLCLGCMSYGTPAGRWMWALDEEHSRPFIRRALELGINFFDTANVYSLGASEEIVGRALRDFATRDEVVIASKVYMPMGPGPNERGLSRKHILSSIDASLKRLGTDYVDLYQIHRWDEETPIEETMEALNDVVRAGKARYIGASTMYAWQFAKALYTSDLHGWARFVSMQPYYNLLYREEEREMLPLCQDQKIAVIPWSPLARGLLTRKPSKESGRNAARPDRCLQETVVLGRRPQACPAGERPGGKTRSANGADRPGLGAQQTDSHRTDHRRHKTPSSGGCRGCALARAVERRASLS